MKAGDRVRINDGAMHVVERSDLDVGGMTGTVTRVETWGIEVRPDSTRYDEILAAWNGCLWFDEGNNDVMNPSTMLSVINEEA